MIAFGDMDQMLMRLKASGYQPPAEAAQLAKGARALSTPEEVIALRKAALTEAIADGDETLIAFCSRDLAEVKNLGAAWDTYHATRAEVAGRVADLIQEDAWGFARDRYNDAGRRFAKALRVVDPDARPEAVVGLRKPQRDAWAAIPGLVAELEVGAVLLGDLVRSLGRRTVCRRYRAISDPKHAAYPLGLLVTMCEAHPRRVAEAWCWRDTAPARVNPKPPTELDRVCRGRGGRWAAIVRTGAMLAVPCENLADYQPYPLADRFRKGHKLIDPYDGGAEWAEYGRLLAEGDRARIERDKRLRAVGGAVSSNR